MTAQRLVAIVGPTATGKSALALDLAQEFGGEIINADSRQVYRCMEIGTAMPSEADRARVPHHLYGIASPAEPFSLALFLRQAHAALDVCWSRDRLSIVVGGTGQYVWALLEGWSVPEVPPDDALRAELTAVAAADGENALHARLAELDPAAAASIDPRNVRRVIRALEVIHATGRPFSEARTRTPPPWRSLLLGLDAPPAELDERIEQRVNAMIAAGLVDEVRRLLDAGVPRTASAMASIGYQQFAVHLSGELTFDEARAETIRATRRLARRQRQWFRRSDPRITWLDSPSDARAVVGTFMAAS
jgi:tRNA dimethylallyltransferase